MPMIRYYNVDVHVQAKVSGVGDGGFGELTPGEALDQVLASLRDAGHLVVVSSSVTETTIGGSPLRVARG
jgi:hypothetical protein